MPYLTQAALNEHNQQKMLPILENGLPPNAYKRKTVTVVGAGMAGLVTASLLRQAGHNVHIIEANDRIGGRVLTLRKPFTRGLCMEAGPMRIPNSHRLVAHYIKKFRIPTHPFINSTPKDLIYVNGLKVTSTEYQRHPDILNFPVRPSERGKSASELFRYAVNPFNKAFRNASPFERNKMIEAFDRFTFANYLLYNPFGHSLSQPALNMIEIIHGVRGFPELSFLEILFNMYGYIENPQITFYEIAGGFDQLPYALYSGLKDIVYLNEELTDIVIKDPHVYSYTKSKYGGKRRFQSDHMVLTIPFTVLQMINIFPVSYFSYKKRYAIGELHYTTATKIGIEFKNRFWENEGIYGGTLTTDLPINVSYYPSTPYSRPGPGIMLASYTWEDGTLPWDSLSEQERIQKALDCIAQVHGKQVYREFVTGASKSWVHDPCTGGGDFALFRANQMTYLEDAISRPEGRIHFAGEHTSNYHGWIEGAIESGIRAALEVHEKEA